jgi:hypothetical protein
MAIPQARSTTEHLVCTGVLGGDKMERWLAKVPAPPAPLAEATNRPRTTPRGIRSRAEALRGIAESDAEIDRLWQDLLVQYSARRPSVGVVSTGADTLSRWMALFRDGVRAGRKSR